ncbi:DUF262 domain-containing protein [Campylobacter upsaliensis]|uniref:Uncharacterized conserved protein n=4 Tax=Campylobacter upsaliensis TaxID=28080 RepID=A0A381EH41_CAMUP|nr:DUF262 domain-containing protein [Campylobacter upsaliensis]MCR2113300.1 DUF262 domain-containing HNH endonuclease family protein [Campylobacter upsaliensis]MCR2120433.1 DUF262 domain-containing HNH endonuclease family protein [Campylobacter upsaliensis]MCR2124044.1 DUF262 domain-containing HNH endonuclease family protein [Campylobacter upsaliensis]SUX26345.1 Uncharacterized conserved protein [Campylobacter upsaliensis]
MKPTESTLKEFFEGDKQFFIPVYQRAYSWEESQWKTFLEDLEEATKGENHYFFGNVLLEKDGNNRLDIIDGQQRLTTIIIFVRCLVNVLDSKGYDKEQLDYIKQDYLENRKKPKLNALEYDGDYFYDVIIANSDNKHKSQTPSQERILKAKEFFTKELKNKEIAQLEEIFRAMQKAQIIKLEFSNKKDSVLMFELQNNRGKDLTNMEKLKSYLAYQIYTYSDKDSAETKLNEMTSVFKEIYRVVVNDIKQLNEDAILGYFNIATSKFGFAYRENDDSLNYKKELKDIKDSEAKLAWIDEYVKGLKNAFFDFNTFTESKSEYKDYLLHLNVADTYPFVIKAYQLFRNDEEKLERVFKALEVIAFRDKLVSTRAKIRDKLNGALKNFDSVEKLESGIKNICDKEWYWTDEKVKEALSPEQYTLEKIAPYIFMRYENALRNKNTRTKGYIFTLQEIQKPQIEHIAPQTKNDEKVASGYCEYDEEFKKFYLNCIGNLMLIAQSHNISIGNNPFADKLQSYEKSPIAQHREIKEFANGEVWDKDSIDKRHKKLEEFVLKTWSL